MIHILIPLRCSKIDSYFEFAKQAYLFKAKRRILSISKEPKHYPSCKSFFIHDV
jgi:hypothetical protein